MRSFPLAALLLAAPAFAQTAPTTGTADARADASQPFNQTADQLRADPTGIDTRTVTPRDGADVLVLRNPTLDTRSFDRLDRDVRSLGQDPNAARFAQERDALRRDYDALGATATPEARMRVMQRYEDLDASVAMSRMNMASRADFFRMADDRMQAYDRDIQASRAAFLSATGDARAERAAELIRLRRQRDMYRNEVFSVRGAGASGFEAARRTAAQNLSRYDTEFRTGRRNLMAQGSMGTQGSMGSMGTQNSQGTQGAAGTQGSMGAQGIQRSTGTQGSAGSMGSQGTQGSTATQGSMGTGTQGAQGSMGTQGTQGTTGSQGSTGTQGSQPAGSGSTTPRN
ncbi:MAG TPA: collagen-like protein [Rubricoccaceae bacterium]|jgi:hypothetical protein